MIPNDALDVVWKPQEGSQTMFLSCPVFEVLYEGTRGPGKTDALIMDFAQYVGRGYGAAWNGILFRQTFPQLQDVIKKTKKWFPRIFPGVKYNEAKFFWTWPTGEMLLLRQYDKVDDYLNYHGHEYPWVGWEELTNWADPTGYLKMMSTCRSTVKGMPRHYRATTNPYGPGHTWVKERFRLPDYRFKLIDDSYDEEGRKEEARVAIFGTIQENRLLLDADPDYINRIAMAAENEAEREAWLYGSWDIIAGGMFSDLWKPRYHVIPDLIGTVPRQWRIYRSYDWGDSSPFSVGWHAVSDGTDLQLPTGKVMNTVRGDIFRLAEWYGCKKGKSNVGLKLPTSKITQGIIEREIEYGFRWRDGKRKKSRVYAGPADTSIFSDERGGPSISVEMAQPLRIDGELWPGVHWTRADKRKGSRKIGWSLLRQMMENSIPPEKGIREKPGVFICERCSDFRTIIPTLPRDKRDPDDLDTDAVDHIADEWRYFARSTGQVARRRKVRGNF
jgi:hypothetical protein